jgi:phosphoribosylaminoimidazolecarboxamide formyltransferase / IMP cyclohydrolase
MSEIVKIKTALISVYYKENLDIVVKKLNNLGVKIISTGGTKSFIEDLGISVTPVEELTSYPSILGGRVKTLHPKVFGGILARRNEEIDLEQLGKYEIPEIDLVIVDLYPFEETLRSDANEQAIIEKIDIGGISLIRAAAKNFKDVLVISSRDQYPALTELLEKGGGSSNLAERRSFAAKAFDVSSHYDSLIFSYFDGGEFNALKQSYRPSTKLRYGENPHQEGYFFGNFDELFSQLHGKEISYNNILDIDAAIGLISEFEEITFAILKHNNACGIASRPSLLEAWKAALAGDPISAFGGVLICNTKVDSATAREINNLFFEIIIAPSYDDEALYILKEKKNRIILIQKSSQTPKHQIRTALNGVIMQDRDLHTESAADFKVVTKLSPGQRETEDLIFANKIVKHTKSNAIVLAKDLQLVASGVGQTSRIDALRHSIAKAGSFNFDLNGAVMASDAFFPFADSVEIAHAAGISAVVQPGGSVKDKDSIDYCDNNNMIMVFTGIRHFKH